MQQQQYQQAVQQQAVQQQYQTNPNQISSQMMNQQNYNPSAMPMLQGQQIMMQQGGTELDIRNMQSQGNLQMGVMGNNSNQVIAQQMMGQQNQGQGIPIMYQNNMMMPNEITIANGLAQLLNASKDAKPFHVPDNATNVLYVEGVPTDSTEREVAHIFRPYPGYQCIRLIFKELNGRKFFWCFVDFDNEVNATIAMQSLKGYRFHKRDQSPLKFAYGTTTKDKGVQEKGAGGGRRSSGGRGHHRS